jgi:hypothetical protein
MSLNHAEAAPKILINGYLVKNWNAATNRISAALDQLRGEGVLMETSQARPTELKLDAVQAAWLLSDAETARQLDPTDVKAIGTFVQNGGGLLITLGGGESQKEAGAIRPLLRHFHVAVNGLTAPPKVQKLSSAMFEGLRFYSPATPLLDIGEDALENPVLIPNDPKQPPLNEAEVDPPGLRIVLGSKGGGRVAVISTSAAFENAALGAGSNLPHHDNSKMITRLFEWLAKPNPATH